MRLSGMNFSVNFGDMKLNVISASLTISDNSAVSQTGGVPDGAVDGDVSAAGDIVVNAAGFKIISEAARRAGSWRALPNFDALFYGKTSQDDLKVEAFGCRLKLSDLLNIDSKGGSATEFKIGYDVTDKDFVHIDGVPYLRPEEIENIPQ